MEEKHNIPGFRPELLSEPYVQHLHSVIYSISARLSEQDKKIAELEAEIRRLKKLPKKPDIKPSKLDESPEDSKAEAEQKETKGGKRKKKESLEDSERDIREFVKRRKISGSTRSENGRKARDTFLSLKKTCRKLGVSFWGYLLDRLKNVNDIPPLAQVMAQKAALSNA
jgi:hypothetical protein